MTDPVGEDEVRAGKSGVRGGADAVRADDAGWVDKDTVQADADKDGVRGGFPHTWKATILRQRPLILPRRRYVYPREAEEVERGALELLIQPGSREPSSLPHSTEPGCLPYSPKAGAPGKEPFLATCALGFADPLAPSGIWSCPDPDQLCAVAGGYAYLIHTQTPEQFEHIPYRPVLAVHAARNPDLLLFVGHRSILAYAEQGLAWESPHLSDEGLNITSIYAGHLHGQGWHMRTDHETPFTLDLKDGRLIHVSGKS